MIRAFALAIAVSTVRVLSGMFDLWLGPKGVGAREVFVLSIWVGWIVTVGGAELWIQRTHRPDRS